MPPRILILTASVGEGHDAPARRLACQLKRERPDVEVVTEDCMPAMGKTVSAVSESARARGFFRFLWLWDVGFWVFAGFAMTRRVTQFALTRFGSRGLLALIDSTSRTSSSPSTRKRPRCSGGCGAQGGCTSRSVR